MTSVPTALRRLVMQRATGRCEYCGLSQAGQEATFHVDHIVPQWAGGETVSDNVALAGVSCSLRKAARQRAIDPHSGHEVPLYHPRHDTWPEHFHWEGVFVRGITPIGRATVEALHMNRPLIVAIRQEEAARGRHPPSQLSDS
jgi:hypothetical protein